jgi:hypothetical protein
MKAFFALLLLGASLVSAFHLVSDPVTSRGLTIDVTIEEVKASTHEWKGSWDIKGPLSDQYRSGKLVLSWPGSDKVDETIVRLCYYKYPQLCNKQPPQQLVVQGAEFKWPTDLVKHARDHLSVRMDTLHDTLPVPLTLVP